MAPCRKGGPWMRSWRRMKGSFGEAWRAPSAISSLAMALTIVACAVAPGCGSKAMGQEERLDWLRRSYRNLAETNGYRYRAEISYSFPDIDEATRARLAASVPSSLNLEGEVEQSRGEYRQHALGTGAGEKLELYVVGGISFRKVGDGEWTAVDSASYRLNISDLYFMAPEDFESMLGFAGEIELVEDSPQRLVLRFTVGSDYLMSSLEKARELYASRDQLQVYEMLQGIMSSSQVEVTSYIYRSNGYLERQDVVMRLPETPLLGTVVMSARSEFFSYGEAVEIELPPEAAKAVPEQR